MDLIQWAWEGNSDVHDWWDQKKLQTPGDTISTFFRSQIRDLILYTNNHNYIINRYLSCRLRQVNAAAGQIIKATMWIKSWLRETTRARAIMDWANPNYSATIACRNKERHEGAFGEMASSLVSRKAEDILLVELTAMLFSMSKDDMRREQKQMFFSQRH